MIKIPDMIHELNKYWEQPSKEEFTIDQLSEYAIMSEEVFKKFKNYSHSQPTGAYEGKMWVAVYGETKYLRWFDTHQLEIIII